MAWKPDYITGGQLGTYMRIFDSQDDAELAVAATSASRAIDKHCNRQFGKTDVPQQRFYTAWYDYEQGQYVIDVDDFMSAAGIVVTVAGTALAAADYDKEPVNAAVDGLPWTRLVVKTTSAVQPTGARNEVAVTLDSWGWLAFPVPVVQAAKLQGSRFHSRRESPYGIAGSPQEGSEMRLLSKLDPDVAVSLSDLVRPRGVA